MTVFSKLISDGLRIYLVCLCHFQMKISPKCFLGILSSPKSFYGCRTCYSVITCGFHHLYHCIDCIFVQYNMGS